MRRRRRRKREKRMRKKVIESHSFFVFVLLVVRFVLCSDNNIFFDMHMIGILLQTQLSRKFLLHEVRKSTYFLSFQRSSLAPPPWLFQLAKTDLSKVIVMGKWSLSTEVSSLFNTAAAESEARRACSLSIM